MLSRRTRPALSLALFVALLGTIGCTTRCPRKPGPSEGRAIDQVSLEKGSVGDYCTLTANSGHLTRRIRATIAWTWSPDGAAPQPKRRTVTITPASSVRVGSHYGYGGLGNDEVVDAEYLD